MEVFHFWFCLLWFVRICFCEESMGNATDLDKMHCARLEKGIGNATVNVGDALVLRAPSDAFTRKVNVMQITRKGGLPLPDWLDFNVTTQVLQGRPELMDKGIFILEFLLQCADCENTCENLTEAVFVSVLIEKPDIMPENQSPILVKPIMKWTLSLGQYFEFQVPVDTFADPEDGTTRNLSLSLSLKPEEDLPASYWIQLDTKSQTVYGMPLAKDFQAHPIEISLVAMDKGGKSAVDVIMMTLNPMPLKDFSHNFVITLDMEKDMFMSTLDNLVLFADKLGKYFGDANSQSVSIITISKGSVIVSWANRTLSKTVCPMNLIKSLFLKLSAWNGSINDHFFRSMLPEFIVSRVAFRYRGVCSPDATDTPVKTTEVPLTHTTEWSIILPALIIVFAILLVLVVAMICIRHFRHRGKSVLRSEKDGYSDFREPVVLPEELEMQELEGKPGHPLVLTCDDGVDNPRLSRTSEDNRPPPPEYLPSGVKDQHPPEDFSTPVQPGYDNGAYQTPPGYRLPPTYSTPGHSSEA